MIDAPRYNFTAHDRVTLRGIQYKWARSNDDVHVFERLSQEGVFESFSDLQFAAEVNRPDYRFERRFFAPGRVEARQRVGALDLHDVPSREVPEVLRRFEWAQRFLKMEQDGLATRSDRSMTQAIDEIFRDMCNSNAPRYTSKTSGRKTQAGKSIKVAEKICAKTLRGYITRFEAADFLAVSLRSKPRRRQAAEKHLDPALESLVKHFADSYASEIRPTKATCYQNLAAALDLENSERTQQGLLPLTNVSRKIFERRIADLDAFEVHAARQGAEAAKRKFRMLGQGLDVTRAGERIEMDEWEVQLMNILAKTGLLAGMSSKEKQELERIRVWMCVALCAGSRCVVGHSFSLTPNAKNAVSALRMIVEDKNAIAKAFSPNFSWDMACTPESIATDAGSSFISDKFKSAVTSLTAVPLTLPAGQPQLRGRGERVHSTIHKQFAGCFTGRTFENVIRKGDYSPEARASLTVEAMQQAFIAYLNIYHNKAHTGLGGETPARAWKRLVQSYGIVPPPGRDLRRHIFGIPVTRVTGRHGLRVLGLHYQSEGLQKHRRAKGDHPVDVRVDPLDLGRVSVRLDEGWTSCDCQATGFDDVSVENWIAATNDLRRRHGEDAKLSLPIVLEAVRMIEAMSKNSIKLLGLSDVSPSCVQLDAWESQLRIGVVIRNAGNDDTPPGDVPVPFNFDSAVESSGPGSASWSEQRLPDQKFEAPSPITEFRIEEDE